MGNAPLTELRLLVQSQANRAHFGSMSFFALPRAEKHDFACFRFAYGYAGIFGRHSPFFGTESNKHMGKHLLFAIAPQIRGLAACAFTDTYASLGDTSW